MPSMLASKLALLILSRSMRITCYIGSYACIVGLSWEDTHFSESEESKAQALELEGILWLQGIQRTSTDVDYQAVFSAVAQLLAAHGVHSHLLVPTPSFGHIPPSLSPTPNNSIRAEGSAFVWP